MRKSVLDSVIKDIGRFSTSVGTEDRQRIDSHLTFVRNIETRLQGASGSGGTTLPPAGTACQPPPIGTALSTAALKDYKNFPSIARLHIDIVAAAFAADYTRFAVLQLGDQGNPDIVLAEAGFTAGGQDGNTGNLNAHHSIAHRNGAEKVKVDKWFMDQTAYAISALKNVTEAGGKTLLDSSVVMAMNNMRTGIHEYVGVPAVMAGSCGGYFKTGRSLKLTNVRNNNVLIGIANAMLDQKITTFGEAAYGGEFTGLKG